MPGVRIGTTAGFARSNGVSAIGWPRIHIPRVTSTMDVLADLARLGASHGTVVTTDFQSAGVGRDGRRWTAPEGSSLLMSVLVRTNQRQAGLPVLSLLVAGAVSEAVESLGVDRVRVKWPNDVLIDDRKVCGILLRSSPDASDGGLSVVIGIGLNLTPGAIRGQPGAIDLATASGSTLSMAEARSLILPAIASVVDRFESDTFRPLLAGLSRRLAYRGQTVVMQTGLTMTRGILTGLRDDGALMLETGHGDPVAVMSGELQRGPRPSEPVT